MQERDVEKRVCQTLWDTFHEFYDLTNRIGDRSDMDLLDDLQDKLEETMPYTAEEVKGGV